MLLKSIAKPKKDSGKVPLPGMKPCWDGENASSRKILKKLLAIWIIILQKCGG